MRVVVEMHHLMIRTWQEGDLASYAALLGHDDENLEKFSADGPDSRAETELWRYQLEQDKNGWSRWAVVQKESNCLIGYCGFAPYHNDVEISWRFLPGYLGRVEVVDAIEAVMKVGLQQLGFDKIISFTSPDNYGALKILAQVGMTLDCLEGWSSFVVARYSVSQSAKLVPYLK